nr:hypothetical protein [Sphaerimonospora thailandensis]
MITVRRWVSPAGTAPGSTPSALMTYGTATSTREPSATTLSVRMRFEPVILAMISPAAGTLRKATHAAYLWISPETDSDSPGRSVGNPATSSRQQLHTPIRNAAPRPSGSGCRRVSHTASTAEPAAISVSETGSSQPYGAKTYSLIMPWSGSRPDTRCRTAIPAAPAPITAFPSSILMPHHCDRDEDAGPSEISRTRP